MEKRKTSMFIPYCFKDNNLYVYLQKRNNDARNPNSLGAFGGGLENGETNEEALFREIKEELEYTPINYSLLGTFEDEYSISNYYTEKVNKNFGEDIIIHEGSGGEWNKATEVIYGDNISSNTSNVINIMIKTLLPLNKF